MTSVNEELWAALAGRRNYPPRRLSAPGPDAGTLERIFEAVAQVPDHGLLRPWRFIVVPDARRADLGEVFAAALAERDPDSDESARGRAREKAFHAPCLVVAVLVDDPAANKVPRAEKLVSLGCAVQNMLTVAQSLGYASGLASGAAMGFSGMRELLRLAPHEGAICFLAFGTASDPRPPRERPRPADFVSTL